VQEYVLASLGSSARIPASISDDAAATLPTNVIAGIVALFHELGIPAPWASPETKRQFGDLAKITLLIVGGGANCGRIGGKSISSPKSREHPPSLTQQQQQHALTPSRVVQSSSPRSPASGASSWWAATRPS
jgi:hypothetical protein